MCHNTLVHLSWTPDLTASTAAQQQQTSCLTDLFGQICEFYSVHTFSLFLFFGRDFFPNPMIEFILTPTPPPPLCQRVSGYSPKRRLSVAGDERDEAETQRQIKGTKTPAIVLLLRVTNRQVKATQRGWNTLASIPFSPPSLLPPLFIFIRFIIGHKGLPTKQLVILVEFIPLWGLQGN